MHICTHMSMFCNLNVFLMTNFFHVDRICNRSQCIVCRSNHHIRLTVQVMNFKRNPCSFEEKNMYARLISHFNWKKPSLLYTRTYKIYMYGNRLKSDSGDKSTTPKFQSNPNSIAPYTQWRTILSSGGYLIKFKELHWILTF